MQINRMKIKSEILLLITALSISKTLKSLEDKNEIFDLSIIKQLMEILSVLLIIVTILYFTCFGCFLVLNDSTSWVAQTVTLSSEGAANQLLPDCMGEYQLAEVSDDTEYKWYRHVDRENNNTIIYNNSGNI